MATAPPAGPPTAQQRPTQLPQATAALLQGLAGVHSVHFPRPPASLAVQPDTSEITTQDQRQDAEQKIALLKSVLSGWMQGVQLDLERNLGDSFEATLENLVALSETLPGSFWGIKAKPRFLLYTSRTSASSTARIFPTPSLVNGSPRKDAPPVASATAALQSILGVEGVNPEEDLATFLVWRSLAVATALQAALLTLEVSSVTSIQQKVRQQRQVALDELEGLVQGVLGTLCDTAVRVEWRTGLGKDVMKDGGIGKARELVEELLEAVQAVIPSTSHQPSSYPRMLTLFESSRAYQPSPSLRSPSKSALPPPEPPRQPSITLKSPLHSRALAVTVLRMLLVATAANDYLADCQPIVIKLIGETWPLPATFHAVDSPAGGLSRKGAEAAFPGADTLLSPVELLSESRTRLAVQYLALGQQVMSTSDELISLSETRLLAQLVLAEALSFVEAPAAQSVEDGAEMRAAHGRAVLAALGRVWVSVKNDTLLSASGTTESLMQLSARTAEEKGIQLVDAMSSDSGDHGVKTVALLVLSLLSLTPSVPVSPEIATMDFTSALSLLPASALAALDHLLSQHVNPPFLPLPASYDAYTALAESAYTALVTDHDARSADPPEEPFSQSYEPISTSTVRKRRRLADLGEVPPSSDGFMDIDGHAVPSSTAAAKRKRGPWKEAVGKAVMRAKEAALRLEGEAAANVFDFEGEAAEAVVVKLVGALPSASPLLATLIFRFIGQLSCARSGNLTFPTILPSDDAVSSLPSCRSCDAWPSSPIAEPSKPSRTFTSDPLDALFSACPAFLAFATSGKNEKLRLAVLNAAHRLLRHTSAEAVLRLVESRPDVLKSLKRELEGSGRSGRMAAGNALLAIVQARQEYDSNEIALNDLLKLVDELLAEDRPAVLETTVHLLGKLARMADPQGRLESESLARIVRLLGNRNAFLKSAAKLQITQTASHRGIKPYALVQPHFAALSPIIISTTSTLNAALDCFHQSRDSLLRVTREHTLPTIITRDQKDLLRQVAVASGVDVPQMLCDPPVAAAIVAHLYMQPDDLRKRGLATLVRECSGIVLSQLLESINIPLVFKLALELGDEDLRVAAQAERALKGVERARVTSNANVSLAEILKNAIVGLLSHMNRGLHDAAHHRPLRDKQKIIRSLDTITTRVGRGIAGFSPQIMATLQTALELPGLRLVTLKAFGSFLRSLKFSDIGPFIGPTTASFVRLWSELSEPERGAAKASISYLVVENATNLADHVKDVADLSGIEGLEQANSRLQRARAAWSFDNWCGHLLDRIAGENDVVTLQALRELKVVLERDASNLQALSAGDSFDPFVGRIVAVLLGAAVKDGPENELARNAAFECIGILGALDPDRFDIPPVEQPPIVLENFENHVEAIDFALRLIEDLLVGAYRSTNDTKHQEFLAYAIQELLRFCGFSADLILASTSTVAVDPVALDRWQRLPKTVVEACAPLLSTRFSLGNLKPMPLAQYPVYSSTFSYRDWTRSFANDLLNKVQGAVAQQVFGAFSGLLHLEDTVVAQQLLPHLLLNVLICGSEEDRDKIKQEMETVLTDQVSPTHALSENSRLLSAQTVFSLMDHLSRWITLARKRLGELKAQRKKGKSKSPIEPSLTEGLLAVEGILQDIPHILVGQAALTCKSFARSLLNFESHIVAQHAQKGVGTDKELQVYYENLHECYAHLDEPDGMEGISTRILVPSVLHQIREHESTGRWTSAQSCWEVKLQQKPDDPVNHVGLLRCLRNLGHYDSMRTHIVGLLHSRGEEVDWARILAPFNIEASLFVGDWESVEDALDIADLEGPEAAFGRVLCAMRDGEDGQVDRAFYEAREQLGGPIVAAGRESYRRVYDSIIHLHVLDELKAIHLSRVESGSQPLPLLVKTLKDRLASTSPSFRAREPILNLRRTAFRLAPSIDQAAKAEVGELWLETSKIARKAGHFQTAYSAILQARDCSADYAFFQSAKLFKASGQTHKAIQELENRLKPVLARLQANPKDESLTSYGAPSPLAKASLRRVRWMLEAGRVDHNEAAVLFREVQTLAPNWETPLFHLGHFWDRLADVKEKKLPKHRSNGRFTNEIATYHNQVVKLYCKALSAGTKYIYQALPRLLTIWLTVGERPAMVEYIKNKKNASTNTANPSSDADAELQEYFKTFGRMNGHIRGASKNLPVYQWLTVLPQLVSRILHPNELLHEVLETILRAVLRSYPHHGFWAMASGAKSNTSRRSKRNLRIFQKVKTEAGTASGATSDVGLLVDEGLKLVDQLLHLCNYPINGKVETLSLKKTFRNLHDLAPTSLIIPLQSSLTVSLPFDAAQAATHKPFPPNLPVIHEFEDVITVMSSLQKPRKITVRGDDGKHYSFLCKPKDDLRKDARLMEFNSMIIKLLQKDSDARSRKLDIRTYSVVPLNEECGLIEWVPHVVVLRGILNKAYIARGIAGWSPELKKTFDTIRGDPHKIGSRFENEVLSRFPSVFHDWFLENFPEPSAWHRARLAYSRTAAVISMVGFVLGLGDRHCENILLDGTTGDTVHVDFNCLFDKGRTFEVAEKVPFRLTHNIIDGMGVTGVEGVYRRSAEIALRILRANKDSLRSVLETFMHDPLVEWSYVSKKRDSSAQPDQTKARALEALDPISNKLMGLQVTSDPESMGPKEVSVEEQVERLIREARDPKNLGSMYVGWCAWF
ncbi:hypothetical protein JCM11641_007903 [Rhodosporidiobolus odoratus]